MTEYELLDITYNGVANITAESTIYFSQLAAYLIVAYTVGMKLTRFQIGYINFLFILLTFVGLTGSVTLIIRNLEFTARRLALGGIETVTEEISLVVVYLFVLFRLLLTGGAITFMWNIRHPKTQ